MDTGGRLAAGGADHPDIAAGMTDLKRMIDPQPLVETGRNWTRFAAPVISVLILAAVIWQLRGLDLAGVRALVPTNPLFWAVFVILYFSGPFSEWVIFRRLWGLPFAGGMAALLRKAVSNEILLGYLGEVYFYAWARRNAKAVAAPFGAIKDVAILSALTGNAATLAMVLLAAPMIGQLRLGIDSSTFVYSMAFMLGTSMLLVLLRKTVFTLPARDLWAITGIHLLRIFGSALLMGLLWHLVLPGVALTYWLLLSTMRQLLTRLPFVPNKDILFVGFASFIVGHDTEIVGTMALIATVTISTHLLVGATLGLTGLLQEKNA